MVSIMCLKKKPYLSLSCRVGFSVTDSSKSQQLRGSMSGPGLFIPGPDPHVPTALGSVQRPNKECV